MTILDKPSDGWIEWVGQKYPLPAGMVVDIRYRDGGVKCGQIALKHTDQWRDAEARFWKHERHHSDIVAYRIVALQQAITP